jgi:hypothetical protein
MCAKFWYAICNFVRVHFNPIIFPTAMKKDYSTKTLRVISELAIVLFQISFVSIAKFFVKENSIVANSYFSNSWKDRISQFFRLKLFVNSIILLFSCISFSSFAQSSPSGQVSFVTPTILSGCNKDTICLNVTNNKGAKGIVYTGNVTLAVTIPGGTLVELLTGSVSSVPTGASQVSYSSTSKVLTMSVPLPAVGATTKVCFAVVSDCNISTLTTLPKFSATITYPSGYPLTTESLTSTSLNVGSPALSVAGLTFNKSVIYNATNFESFKLTNSGYGNIDNFKITIVSPNVFTDSAAYVSSMAGNTAIGTQQGTITPISTTVGATETTKVYQFSGSPLFGGDGYLSPGESMAFTNAFTTPSVCGAWDVKIKVEVLCGNNKPSCIVPIEVTDRLTLSAGTPILTGSLISAEKPDGCPNKVIEYSVKNTGVGNAAPVGNAYDVNFGISFNKGLASISNVKVGSSVMPTTNISPSKAASNFTITLKDKLTADPDGAGGISDLDGDGFFDDMKVGDSTKVHFEYTIPCDLACGANLYYEFSSNNTFTDFCKTLNGKTNTPLLNFGFQQVQAIVQGSPTPNYGSFNSTTPPVSKDAVFQFQYQAVNMDLSNATAQLRINYSKAMEVTASSIRINGVAPTNTPVLLGTGATFGGTAGTADKDSAWVVNLTPAEIAFLTDANPDSIRYTQTRYSCNKDRQKTIGTDDWQLIFTLKQSLCADGSKPCALDLACKKPYAYSYTEGCGTTPCYNRDIVISRLEPKGFTNVNENTTIGTIDKVKSYSCDTVMIKMGSWISADRKMEANGFWTNQGNPSNDIGALFNIYYTKPKNWNGNIGIGTFLEGYSTVSVRKRNSALSSTTNNVDFSTAPIIEVPLLLEDFATNFRGNASSSSQIQYATGTQTSEVAFQVSVCASGAVYMDGICPANGIKYNKGTGNISYERRMSATLDKATDSYWVNIGKALARGGWTGDPGDDDYYFEIKTQWKMNEQFPWDNSNSWNTVWEGLQHGGNKLTSSLPNSTNIGTCPGKATDTHLTVAKNLTVENPRAVYNADCGLRACNTLKLNSYQGNYFDASTGEVRVPYKLDSVVVDVPSQYGISNYSFEYNQSCTVQTSTAVTASATTGHIKFTKTGGGDFPRTDDCAGNKVAYKLCYDLTKKVSAAPTNYKLPVKYYTRDEFDNIVILYDTMTIAESKPVLTLSALTPPTVTITDGGACSNSFADYQIQNNTLYDAPNVYFAVESSTTTKIVNITDGDKTYPDAIISTDTATYSSVNKIAKIGTLKAGDVRVVRVYFRTSVCKDSIKVYTDFGCVYPTPLAPTSTTSRATSMLKFEALNALMAIRPVTSSLSITELCTDKDVEFEIKNTNNANLYKVLAQIKLPASMSYVANSMQIKYPTSSSTYTTLAAASVTSPAADSVAVNFSAVSPFSTACGLAGADSSTINAVRVKFKVSFKACPKSSKEEIIFYSSGENFCGTKTKGVAVVPVNYLGNAGTQNAFTISGASSNIKICAAKGGIQAVNDTLWIKNLGGFGTSSGATSGLDSLDVTLAYDPGNLTATNIIFGAPFTGAVVGTNSEGKPLVKVLVPSGVAVGDSIALPISMNITPKIDKLCELATTPNFCYFAEFKSKISLICAAKSLDCSVSLPSVARGTGISVHKFTCCFGSIGDYVWLDNIQDGQQGVVASEPPIAGVKVYLLNGITGAKIDSTVTDANGKYLFDSLKTGSYQVKFVAPKGKIITTKNAGDPTTDSNIDTAGLSEVISINTTLAEIDLGRNNPTIDAGFYTCTPLNAGADLSQCGTANGQYQFAAAPSGQTWVKLSGTGSTINATTGLVSNLSAGVHQFILKYAISNECADTVKITYGITPDLSITATPATCPAIGGNANNDAKINLVNTNNGIKIDYTSGSTYTGTKSYASLPTGMPVGNVITLPNPSITKNYTVRLYNQGGTCFVDKTLEIKHIDCPLVCPPQTCLPNTSTKN